MSEFVVMENVKKTYKMGEVMIHAVDGVDIEIHKGEFAVIEVAESSRSAECFKRLLGQDAPVFLQPVWMEREKNALKGTITRLPAREEIDVPVEEHLIVELYSK